MTGFPIADLVIGLIFIYFLLSIICSSAIEIWFSILKTRAGILELWLKRIFDKPALDSEGNLIPETDAKGNLVKDKNNDPMFRTVGQEIMDHCMVTGLSKKGTSTSYIDADNFVSALLDKITISAVAEIGAIETQVGNVLQHDVQIPPSNLGEYIIAIRNSTLISGELKRTILSLANEASQAASVLKNLPPGANLANSITAPIKSELDHFRDRLEKWYDSNADRLTGTLKRRKALPATLIIATILTIALNTNSIEISKYLYNNKDVSKQLATTALDTYKNYQQKMDTLHRTFPAANSTDSAQLAHLDSSTTHLKQDIEHLKALDLPIGWEASGVSSVKEFLNYAATPVNFMGWLATILAICMGAPFWFDILNKIANLRGSGPKPASLSGANNKNS